jgi:hypothetical protein
VLISLQWLYYETQVGLEVFQRPSLVYSHGFANVLFNKFFLSVLSTLSHTSHDHIHLLVCGTAKQEYQVNSAYSALFTDYT